uniref:Uncharacterized protein n=1 Tax=Anopheles minimus TaxID=112268 RepID=A0A182WN87_9DIPT
MLYITATIGRVTPQWHIPGIYRRHLQDCVPGVDCPQENPFLIGGEGQGTGIMFSEPPLPIEKLHAIIADGNNHPPRSDTIPSCVYGELGCEDYLGPPNVIG